MSDSNVIQFKPKKTDKPAAPKKTAGQAQQAELTAHKTNQQILMDVAEDLMGEWQQAAVGNRLSEYIGKKIPAFARGPKMCDYVNDLNVISNVEAKLNMKLTIFFPTEGQNGWLVATHVGDEVYSAPPNLPSEAMARALNIVLFVSYTNALKTLGRL